MRKGCRLLIVFLMLLLTACTSQENNPKTEPTNPAGMTKQPEPTETVSTTLTEMPTPAATVIVNADSDIVIEDGVMTKYTGRAATVEVPYGVTAVGEYCFKENQALVTVILPDTVSDIGTGAFSQCHSL